VRSRTVIGMRVWLARAVRLAAVLGVLALLLAGGPVPASTPLLSPPVLGRPPVPVFGDFAPVLKGAGPAYYLSLGDSLAVGVQPDEQGHSVPTPDGYADRLYQRLRRTDPRLELVKLGCSGENTATMLGGGICGYPGGSQAAAAVAFLAAHPGRVRLVTLDIGANDLNHCAQNADEVDVGCAVQGLSSIATNLPALLGMIRSVAPRLPVLAMNYYDPFLVAWLRGSSGPRTAIGTVALTAGVNGQLEDTYHRYDVRVVSVQDAFATTDLLRTVRTDRGMLPIAVARICSWTWMCAPAPVGPNIHANRQGYQVIADAFWQAI
jgi:lysophospholipase L1-like esterase